MNPNLGYPGYQSQQAPPSRTTPLGSGRLQNVSKVGNSWGFGAPTNRAAGITGSQGRQSTASATSFAQTIGGSQPATPLDMSEFPSLSGNSQPQFHNPSQAIWQRNIQQTPVQRPQQTSQPQISSNPQIPQNRHNNQSRHDLSLRESNEDMFTGSSHLQSSLDDFQPDGQGPGQMAGPRPQTTNIEDFPPLGRNGTAESDGNQRSPFGAFSSSATFPPQSNPAPSQPNVRSGSGLQLNNNRSPSANDTHTVPNAFGPSLTSHSPLENGRSEQLTGQNGDMATSSGPRGSHGNSNTFNSLIANLSDNDRQTQESQRLEFFDTGNHLADGSTNYVSTKESSQRPPLTSIDRQGLGGLLAAITSEDPVERGLARGIDLNSLGMNLNSTEPLYPAWGGPYAETGSRPLQPYFDLPECYTVENVHRVRDKMPGFVDETLFYIFYTQPRDMMQELAANELHNRNWRYHKIGQMWLTKDPSQPEPMRPDPKGEQGNYIFFDQKRWEKSRAEFYLLYDDLAPTSGRSN